MVEQYFRTSFYKIALWRFKKKFKEMPDPKMTQRVVERFQTASTLEDEPRSGRPHTLSDDGQFSSINRLTAMFTLALYGLLSFLKVF